MLSDFFHFAQCLARDKITLVSHNTLSPSHQQVRGLDLKIMIKQHPGAKILLHVSLGQRVEKRRKEKKILYSPSVDPKLIIYHKLLRND